MTMPISLAHARELARLIEHEEQPDLVLIGAVALGHHLPLGRGTSDVDLALVVSPSDVAPLLASLGWKPDKHIAQRWYAADEFRADVLPATPALIAKGAVQFDGDAKLMSLVGFDLAMDHAAPVALPGTSTTVKVASLPAIVVLKIVAWLDRPYERGKDLADLARIFKEALGDDNDRRWEQSDPVGASGLEFEDQSPFSVGLDVAAIMRESHRAVVDTFVGRLLDDTGTAAAQMARAAGMHGDDADERVQRLVTRFAEGIERGRAR